MFGCRVLASSPSCTSSSRRPRCERLSVAAVSERRHPAVKRCPSSSLVPLTCVGGHKKWPFRQVPAIRTCVRTNCPRSPHERTDPAPDLTGPDTGRPLVFRGGTVLTMDAASTVLTDADVLVVGDRIEAVGPALEVPAGTLEVDARGGIVMPGMIDTHRHMWQTAMRGYGADWTLTQYFVWYYLEHGKKFRPQDIAAGNRLAAIESLDAGVTTTVDWSHNLQTVDHAEAALDALRSVPGRFVLAYGNIQAGPWEWTADPAVRVVPRAAARRRRRPAGRADRLRRHRRPGVPGAGGLRGGPGAGHPGHHARRRLGRDQRHRHPADVRRRLHDTGDDVRARVDPDPGLLPADRGDRRLDLGGHRVRVQRRAGARADRAGAAVRHPGVAVDGHQRVVERRHVLGDAVDAERRPDVRAPDRAPQGDTITHLRLRAKDVVEWAPAAGRTTHRPRTTWAASRRARRPTSC